MEQCLFNFYVDYNLKNLKAVKLVTGDAMSPHDVFEGSPGDIPLEYATYKIYTVRAEKDTLVIHITDSFLKQK